MGSRHQKFSIEDSIPDSHLQSPIRPHDRNLFLSKDTGCPPWIRGLALTCPIPRGIIRNDSEKTYGLLLRQIYIVEEQSIPAWISLHVNQAYEVSWNVLSKTLAGIGVENLHKPAITADILRLYACVIYWEDVRAKMQYYSSDCKTWKVLSKLPSCATRGYYSGSFLLLYVAEQWYLYNYEQVMMIADTILARGNTLILHMIRNPTTPGTLTPEVIIALYQLVDQHFQSTGNDLYRQIKSWESVTSGLLIQGVDPYPGGKRFLDLIRADAEEQKQTLVLALFQLLETLELDMHQLAEIYGMFRHFGHPTVDENAGCKKVKDITKNRPLVSQHTMQEIRGSIIKQFCVSFISKHGRWPAIDNVSVIKCPTLRRMVTENITYMNLYTSKIKTLDWAVLQIKGELKFEYYVDYTQLLDDKSLAPLLQDLPSIYNQMLTNLKVPPPRTSRRLLKQAMDIASIDIKKICKLIQDRQIHPEWFIIILHAKERELKLDPRLFAMMVLEMRLYFCTTENNISKKIFPFFPQQTMTMTEAERDNRLLGFTEGSTGKGDGYISLFKSIDFKSWNLHWSELSTSAISEFLDEVFGTHNLFNFGHEFFSQCTVALASPLNPPKDLKGYGRVHNTPESERLWRNHMGGFEGIMQKLWTLTTIGLLLLVEEKTGIKAQIVGQGDNQICRITIPKSDPSLSTEDYIRLHLEEVEAYSRLFDTTLDQLCSRIGLVVKTEESVTSSNVLIYGKDIIVKGVYLAQATKKASRIMPDTNDMYPTLADAVATTQTAGLSTGHKSHEFFSAYLISAVGTLLLFTRAVERPMIFKSPRLPEQIRRSLLTMRAKELILRFDPNLGGLPITNPLEYLYRGHPDPLTAYTTFLHILAESNDEMAIRIINYLEAERFEIGQAEPRLLIENPCSLNIKKPPALTSGFRTQLEKFLEEYPRNKDLKSMMRLSKKKNEEEFYLFLLKHTPLHLRFLHEVSALTIYGSKRNFVGAFSSTRTTKMLLRNRAIRSQLDDNYDGEDLIPNNHSQQLSAMIVKCDQDLLQHISDVLTTLLKTNLVQIIMCPTQLARHLRQISWRPLIGGNTIEGVTIPHPAHQFIVTLNANPGHTTCVGGPEHVLFVPPDTDKDLRITRGDYPHLVGGKTREKVTGKVLQLPAGSRSLDAAKRAIQLNSWCVVDGSSMQKILYKIAESRTNVPPELLLMAAGSISGGSVTHRLRDNVTKHETLGGNPPNITSCIYISSDNLGKLSRGQDNYNIHFQGAIHLGYAVAQAHLGTTNVSLGPIHLHYNQCACEERIDDMYIVGDEELPEFHTDVDNPLIYCPIQDIDLGELSNLNGIQVSQSGKASRAAATVLLDRIRQKARSAIWGVSDNIRPSVSTLGIKEIERLGIHNILNELAELILLYYDLEGDQIQFFLKSLPSSIWSDIASICLLPSIYKDLMQGAQIEGVTDAYYRNGSIATAVVRLLVLRIQHLTGLDTSHIATRTYFLSKNVNLVATIHAWAQCIWLQTRKTIDIRGATRLGVRQYYQQNIQDRGSSSLMTCVLYQCSLISQELPIHLLAHHPFRICKHPPESFFGDQLPLRAAPKRRPYHHLKVNIEADSTDYIAALTLKDAPLSTEWGVETTLAREGPSMAKSREDHMYRVVGQLSTAWAKILEILIREGINSCTNAICVAEGEGSIHKLLSHKYGAKTIYNNLVTVPALSPQRAADYRPGCFVENPDNVKGGHIGVQTGGDLTKMETILAIVSEATANMMIPCGIITCDAESSSSFSPNFVRQLTNAILLLSVMTKTATLIMKIYSYDEVVTAHQLKTCQRFFNQVKLVVPTFSSYETTESYIVCHELREDAAQHTIHLSTITPKYVIGPVITFTQEAVREFNSKRSNCAILPYQELKWDLAKSILKAGLEFGFRHNGAVAYERYLEKTYVVNTVTEHTLERVRDYLRESIKTYSMALRGLEHGRNLPPEWALAMSKTTAINADIGRFSTAYLNNHILLLVIQSKLTRQDALMLIQEVVSATTDICDPDGEVLYTLTPVPYQDWCQKYLKFFWRVYGTLAGGLTESYIRE